jgi:signal transduction histidine kinase
LALLLAALLATAVSRPVRALATAADRLASGDFHAPLDRSRLDEVDRMAAAFERMRTALAGRLDALSGANRQLEERQEKLRALQSELIRRDRLAASGRLVAELAHEIRNPVANIRNCLEVVHRRVKGDAEARRFTDLAIDELLRMHELAEQMLDLNRPLDPGASRADPAAVVRQVAHLFRLGGEGRWPIELSTEPGPDVLLPPDTLKQVVLNLLQNAREAMPGGGRVGLAQRYESGRGVIEVTDEGTGIRQDDLDRVFDAFFTTKGEVSGAGLGLFIAQGLAARAGGRLSAANREIRGAVFRLELPISGVATRAAIAGGAGDHADR